MSDRKITTVIFDLDGTLLDTLEDLKNATNYALKLCGMPVRTLDEVRRFVGNGVKNLMIRAVPDGEDNPQFERAFDAFKAYYAVHCNDATRAYDGIPELLQELKKDGNIRKIVLFGSSLEFRCSSNSDIDLYIEKIDCNKPFVKEPVLDCEVDILADLDHNSRLYRQIDQTGLILYERGSDDV